MKQNNTIIWQKWFDPFGEDIDDDIYRETNDNQSDVDPEDEYPGEDYEWPPQNNSYIPKIVKGIKVIATPMGIIPINENTASGKIFNFWMGHTNFNITSKICDLIENTDGVECLDIFTRYRFRIAIGKAFNDADTMLLIQNNIYNFLENKNDDDE
jgi:hypothetical protein